MTQSALQWLAFARDVARHRRLWTIQDDGGFPAPLTSSGKRAHPFWSTLPRVLRIIQAVAAYLIFRPHEVTWDAFRDDWIPGMERDGLLVGVNWSGPTARGYDVLPSEAKARIEFEIAQLSKAAS